MEQNGLFPVPPSDPVRHEGGDYGDVPIPLVGVEYLKDDIGKVFGHDSRSPHESLDDARLECEAMRRRAGKK